MSTADVGSFPGRAPSDPLEVGLESSSETAYLEFFAMHFCMNAMRSRLLIGQKNCPIFVG